MLVILKGPLFQVDRQLQSTTAKPRTEEPARSRTVKVPSEQHFLRRLSDISRKSFYY